MVVGSRKGDILSFRVDADHLDAVHSLAGVEYIELAGKVVPHLDRAVRVTRTVTPGYEMWDGAAARRDADALCGGRVRSSIYDRYEAGTWVFVEGCA